jgi:hypothetical protein
LLKHFITAGFMITAAHMISALPAAAQGVPRYDVKAH